MADIKFRLLNLIVQALGKDAPSASPPIFNAVDNGDGTWSLVVAATSIPAPTNFANETGGNLAKIAAQLGATIIKPISSLVIVSGTPQVIWTPASGKQIQLMGVAVASSNVAAVIFKYGSGHTELFRTPALQAAVPFPGPQFGAGVPVGAANDTLQVDATAGTTASGFVFGREA